MNEIWYFAPTYLATEDRKIRRLLGQVQRRWGIDHRDVNALGRQAQEEIYSTFFAPSGIARLLSERTGRRVEQDLKRSTGAVHVRGIVALAEDDALQWYCTSDRASKFLRDLLRRGPDLISEIYEQTRTYADVETMLLDAMEADQLIPGDYERGVYVGKALRDEFPGVTLKIADAICTGRDGQYWAIEAEAELNHTAIGQATVYRYLYSRDNPGRTVRPAIVCGSAAEDLLAACKDGGIEVFVIPSR